MSRPVVDLIYEVLAELNEELNLEALQQPTLDTRLYGDKSGLDSVALVTLIAALEERCSAEFGRDIVIADERAMSQTRSPFRRVGTLASYVESLLGDQPGPDPQPPVPPS